MTDPIDPIDNWLGADVELLQPPAGTYRTVAGRARRRRTVRAMTVAASAVVVIAAAVTVPQLAATLLPGSGSPARVAAGSSAPASSPSGSASGPSQSARPSPRSSAKPTASGPARPGPALSTASSGQSAAPGFRPTSVTFIDQSVGAALGQAGSSCGTQTCTSVAGTATYGQSWYKVGAPAAGAPDGGTGVSQVRFRNLLDGWAYGPQLFATHDGGQTWRPITDIGPGRVIDLATVGDQAFAVLATCSGAGPDFAADCTSFRLLSSAISSDSWQAVPGASASVPVSPGGLQITGQGGYLLAHGVLYAGSVSGGSWQAVPTSSSSPSCLRAGQRPGAGLLAPQSSELYLVCTRDSGSTGPVKPGSLILYASPDGGQTWQAHGAIPEQGTATSLAVAPDGAIVLATSADIYYSTDATTWHQAGLSGQAPPGGFSFVGMTTALLGVAVPTEPGLHEIFTTVNGGQTWGASNVP